MTKTPKCKNCKHYTAYDRKDTHNSFGFCALIRDRLIPELGEDFQYQPGYKRAWADVALNHYCDDFEAAEN